MKMQDEHSLIAPRVSCHSSASKSQPTNFTFSLRAFLHLRYNNTDETHEPARAYGAHEPTRADAVSCKGPLCHCHSISWNAKASRSSLFRTMLQSLFEVHPTTVLELRLFHIPEISSDRNGTPMNLNQPRFHVKDTRVSVDTMSFSTGAKFELRDVATHFQSRSQFHPSELHQRITWQQHQCFTINLL